MIDKHQQTNGIGRGKITINPEYIKRAREITVGGQPVKILSSNPNTGRVLAQFPDGHTEEVKAAPDYFIGGNTSTKELKNNQPIYGETNTAANERADSQDEAHDLTPIFSNLITAGQISTMNEGAQDLQNGKYLEGTTKLLSPAMFGSGIGGIAARSGIGGYNLFNKNGVRKTYNLFNQGHYGEGVLSLLGDTFNAAMATEGLGSISNALKGTSGYRNWRLANAINKGVKENAVITAYNRNPVAKDIGNLWDYQSYLDNVFPNSKVKDVLWHGSRSKNLETFNTNMIGSHMPIKNSVGMYLTPERNIAVGYGTRGSVYPVLLNTENPFITNQFFGGISKNGVNVTKISPKVRRTLLANNDAVIAPRRGEIAFFDPDNALILGSNRDMQGFQKFMKSSPEKRIPHQPQLQYQKQGGKMNILEFLKNGSGIHIKKKNRGKFTKYCHGKVTDECIRKAKASGNPTLVKRATFADNARHFKHKDGGKAFVNGVNVLDSNPKMYKYNKKYKMAQEGAKLTFWQQAGNWIKDNQNSISTIGNGISNLISAKNRQDEINQFAQAKQKELKAFKYKTWKDKYLSNLQNQTDRSDIVNAHNAFNQTNINDALQEKQNEINNQIANLQYLNDQQDTGLGDITSGLLGIATNILQGTAKKKKIDNTFSPLANQTMSQIRGKLLDINANFSE